MYLTANHDCINQERHPIRMVYTVTNGARFHSEWDKPLPTSHRFVFNLLHWVLIELRSVDTNGRGGGLSQTGQMPVSQRLEYYSKGFRKEFALKVFKPTRYFQK